MFVIVVVVVYIEQRRRHRTHVDPSLARKVGVPRGAGVRHVRPLLVQGGAVHLGRRDAAAIGRVDAQHVSAVVVVEVIVLFRRTTTERASFVVVANNIGCYRIIA